MISILGGSGFIGSRFYDLYPNDCIKVDRNDYVTKSDNTLYFISTTDNHNIFINPCLDVETNLLVLLKVIQSCKSNDTFNYISTWSVYGNVELPAKEDAFCNPLGFYGITKRTAEQLVISYCSTFGINYRILRLCNVLGETDKGVSKKKNAIQYLIGELANNRDINLYYNGEFYRDYLYVDDVCTGIKLVLDKGNINEIYNIGSGTYHKFRDVIMYAHMKLDSKSNIGLTDPKESAFHTAVQSKNMYLDNTKLKSLGFIPKYSVYDAIDKVCYQ